MNFYTTNGESPYSTGSQDPGAAMRNMFNMASGGYQPGSMMGMLQMLGQFAGQPIMPTSGYYSPMAMGLQQQTMREMGEIRARAQGMDVDMYTAMYMNTQNSLMGPGQGSLGAASSWANMQLGLMNNPMTIMAMQANPQMASFIEALNPGGSTMAMAGMNLYAGTRHLGVGSNQVSHMLDNLAMAYHPGSTVDAATGKVTDPTGKIDYGFTRGLNQREIADSLVQGMNARAIDPEMLAGDSTRAKEVMGKYAALTSSLKDLFGPDAPISQMYSHLQQMTQGGLSQVDPGQLRVMVDRMKSLSLTSGLTTEGIAAMSAQGAVYARQHGLPGMFGTNVMLDAMGETGSVLGARQKSSVWGKMDQYDVGNDIAQESFNVATSAGGVAAMNVLRLQQLQQSSGMPVNAELDRLAGAIRGGTLKSGDIDLMRNVQGLARDLGGAAGLNVTQVRDFLGNRVAGAEFAGKTAPALGQLAAEDRRLAMLDYFGGAANDFRLNHVTGDDVRSALLGADNDEGDRRKKLAALIKSKNPHMSDAAAAAQADTMYTNISNVMSNVDIRENNGRITRGDLPSFLDRDSRQTVARQHEDSLKQAHMVEMEERAKGLGIGAMHGIGQRVMDIMTSTGKVDTAQLFNSLIGRGSQADIDKVSASLFGGNKDAMTSQVRGVAFEVSVLAERARTDKSVLPQLKAKSEELDRLMKGSGMGLINNIEGQTTLNTLMGGIKYGVENGESGDALLGHVDKFKTFINSAEGMGILGATASYLDERGSGETGFTPEEVQGNMNTRLDAIRKAKTDGERRSMMKQFEDDFGYQTSGVLQRNSKGGWDFNERGFAVQAIDAGSQKTSAIAANSFTSATTVLNNVTINHKDGDNTPPSKGSLDPFKAVTGFFYK